MTQYFQATNRSRDLTGSRKKQFRFSPGATTENVDSYWDGGSKSSYHVHNIDTGLAISPQGNAPFGAHGKLGYTLIKGDILIETGTFCGKPATPCFICRAEDAERVLQYLGVAVMAGGVI